MPAGYSLDLRERVVDAVEKGASSRCRWGIQSERQHRDPLDETAGDDRALCAAREWWGSSVDGPRTTQGLATGTGRGGAGRNAG